MMNRNTIAIALASLIVTGAVAGPAAADKHALIVSVNEYGREQWKLHGSVNDGLNIKHLLLAGMHYQDDQIKVLFDRDATRAAILDAFKSWLIDGTKAGDEVFFYFSGHGYQQKDTNGDEDDGLDEALVAADADLDGHGGVRNMIIDDEIGELLAKIPDRKVTFVVDSCHSGTITRDIQTQPVEGGKALPELPGMEHLEPISKRGLEDRVTKGAFVESSPNLTVWTAVAPDQLALEESRANPIHGVFTSRFVKGILEKAADANGDGIVTTAELLSYVQRESDSYCQAHNTCTAGLTPTLEAARSLLPLPVTDNAGAAPTSTPTPATPAALQNSATALLANDNQGGVQIEILPGAHVRIGQTVHFRVTTRIEGSLVLLDANAAGQLVQLFPNKFSQAQNRTNRIYVNRPLTVPDPTYGFEFTATEPAGEGTLIALVLQDPVDVSPETNANRDLNPVPRPVDYMAQIAERLRRPWTQGEHSRMTRWSMTSQKYLIDR